MEQTSEDNQQPEPERGLVSEFTEVTELRESIGQPTFSKPVRFKPIGVPKRAAKVRGADAINGNAADKGTTSNESRVTRDQDGHSTSKLNQDAGESEDFEPVGSEFLSKKDESPSTAEASVLVTEPRYARWKAMILEKRKPSTRDQRRAAERIAKWKAEEEWQRKVKKHQGQRPESVQEEPKDRTASYSPESETEVSRTPIGIDKTQKIGACAARMDVTRSTSSPAAAKDAPNAQPSVEMDDSQPKPGSEAISSDADVGKVQHGPEETTSVHKEDVMSEVARYATMPVPPAPLHFLPFPMQHRLMVSIQTMLEQACFEYLQRNHPEVLTNRYKVEIDCPESLELNHYIIALGRLARFDQRKVGGLHKDLSLIYRAMIDVRNHAVHRNRVSINDLQMLLHDAAALVKLMKIDKAHSRLTRMRNEVKLVRRRVAKEQRRIESEFLNVVKDLAAKRAELDRLEKEALEAMVKERRKLMAFDASKLEQALNLPSLSSEATIFATLGAEKEEGKEEIAQQSSGLFSRLNRWFWS